jgi:hypothetical protein
MTKKFRRDYSSVEPEMPANPAFRQECLQQQRRQTCGLPDNLRHIFLPSDANLTACAFEKNNLLYVIYFLLLKQSVY